MGFGTEAGAIMPTAQAGGLRRILTGRPVAVLAVLIAIGELVRLIVAAKGVGVPFDLRSYDLVRQRLLDDPWHVYSLNASSDLTHAPRWPYPPGFFPFILGADGIADLVSRPFSEILRMVVSAADVPLAIIVWSVVRRRAGEASALLAAASVLIGPVFILVTADHGQLDAFAWLAPAAALAVWQHPRWSGRRALIAGVLIGIGIAIKTVPGLMLLALLPSARDRREVVTLVLAAAAVPILLYLPFLAERHDIAQGLRYHGVPGLGGISMLLQPGLAHQLLQYGPIEPTGISLFLLRHGGVLSGLAIFATFAWLARRRVAAPEALAVLVLVTLVFGFNYLPGYSVWGLLALLLAGRVAWAVALQLVLTLPTLMLFLGIQTGRRWSSGIVYGIYVPLMALVLAAWVAAAVVLVRRVRRATVVSA